MSTYTEEDTKAYYTIRRDNLYRFIWDKRGTLHWGIFPHNTKVEQINHIKFSKSMKKLNSIMLNEGHINSKSIVLDACCGNGITAVNMAAISGAYIEGVDLSDNRISNARKYLDKFPHLREKINFTKSSLLDLPFKDKYFDTVYSQSSIYHIPDKHKAITEIHRCLKVDGYFVFDDLFKPQKRISALSKKYVYDRLAFDTDINFISYQTLLSKIGFNVILARDLTTNLMLSYDYLAQRAQKMAELHGEECMKISEIFEQSARAAERNEVGWGLFICKKI